MTKMLYIDDDPRPTEDIFAILYEKGYEILYDRNPSEAINTAEKYGRKISLIILDLMMSPETLPKEYDTGDGIKTGLVLYQKILIKLLPNVPVIVMTALLCSDVWRKLIVKKWFLEYCLNLLASMISHVVLIKPYKP